MRPRKPRAMTAAVLAAFALHCAAAGENPPEDAPQDIFSHAHHVADQQLPCADCHPRPFMKQRDTARAKGEFNHQAFDQGRACGSCHNDSFAFSTAEKRDCERCHKNGVPE